MSFLAVVVLTDYFYMLHGVIGFLEGNWMMIQFIDCMWLSGDRKHLLQRTHWQHLITIPAPNTTTAISTPNPAAPSFLTHPADITVALGEPAVFRCGVPEASPNITFTFYGSHGNYSLTCPHGHVEDIPQVRWSPPLSTRFLPLVSLLLLFPWSRTCTFNLAYTWDKGTVFLRFD